MNQTAVEIVNLSRHFGSFKAVDNISLTVQSGEIFGFLGANGAGKTTTIRMLCGLLLPTSGSGRVAGFDIYKEYEKIKENIGYMSQKYSLYRDLTGYQNLLFFGAAYNLPGTRLKERITELSEQLELSEFIGRQTSAIPAGWRQRLSLATALLHQPRILFLDEPTAGVDPIFRRKFWQILYRLAEDGVTVFVTTHYMDEAEYCGRISIMHAGRIIELGQPRALVKKHQVERVEDLFLNLVRVQEAGSA